MWIDHLWSSIEIQYLLLLLVPNYFLSFTSSILIISIFRLSFLPFKANLLFSEVENEGEKIGEFIRLKKHFFAIDPHTKHRDKENHLHTLNSCFFLSLSFIRVFLQHEHAISFKVVVQCKSMHAHCTNGSGRFATKQTIDNTHINGMRRFEFHKKKHETTSPSMEFTRRNQWIYWMNFAEWPCVYIDSIVINKWEYIYSLALLNTRIHANTHSQPLTITQIILIQQNFKWEHHIVNRSSTSIHTPFIQNGIVVVNKWRK